MLLIGLAGLPAIIVPDLTFPLTTEQAPTITLSSITVPGSRVQRAPINTLFPIVIGFTILSPSSSLPIYFKARKIE